MPLRTTVELDELRETPKNGDLPRLFQERYNDLAQKFNRLVLDLKRSAQGSGTTIVLAGGGVLVSAGTGSVEGHRAGTANIGEAETLIPFSSAISGSFVLNKPRCYLASNPKINVEVEIYDLTNTGFKVKAAMNGSVLEWSTLGVV